MYRVEKPNSREKGVYGVYGVYRNGGEVHRSSALSSGVYGSIFTNNRMTRG